jgi:hypothetical protein
MRTLYISLVGFGIAYAGALAASDNFNSSESAPQAIVGTWGAGAVSATTFVDSRTGSYSSPSGTQVQYRFLPDGRYEYASLTTQSMYSCTTKLMTHKTGVVAYEGNRLTFVPQSGKFTSQDNCIARNNYEKPVGMDRESYRWRIEQDASGVKMCLQNEKVNGCAYRR